MRKFLATAAILAALACPAWAANNDSSAAEGFVGVVVLIACVVFYFLPTLMARDNKPAIFALNLLLGWTFVGWVAALVWALITRSAARKIQVERDIDRECVAREEGYLKRAIAASKSAGTP